MSCRIATLLRSTVSPFSSASKAGIACAEYGSVRSRVRADSVTLSISQSRSVHEDKLARFVLVEGRYDDVVLDEHLDAFLKNISSTAVGKMHEDHMFRVFLLTWATLFDGGIVRS